MLPSKKYEGAVLGAEGSGVVVDVGEGVNHNLLGRFVSFLGSAWATHCVCELTNVILMDSSIDLKDSANAFVNPLTACGQLDIAMKHRAKSVIITASSSSLSKQFIRLCLKEGI